MSRSRRRLNFLEVLGYLLGGVMLLPAIWAVAGDSSQGPLSLVVGLTATGLSIISGAFTFWGNRRILPVAVSREGGAVVCRYIPWLELNSYTVFLLLPILGITGIVLGLEPGRPVWLVFAGLLALGGVVRAGYAVGQMWRRCLLRITPTALTVRLPARGSQLTEIARSRIESITDAQAEVSAAIIPVNVTQIFIAYQPADPGTATTQTVLIGPPPGKTAMQVSVHQPNMITALHAWKDADPDDPGLMDRVEAILRGKAASAPGGVANL
jgi:hypothetical protein